MDNLLFYALLACLVWYFFYYLPAQKKHFSLKPSTVNQSIQTEPTDINGPEPLLEEKALETTLDLLIKEMTELDKALD